MPAVASPMAQALLSKQQPPTGIKSPPSTPQLPTTTPALSAMQNTVFAPAQPVKQELLVNRIQKAAASLAPGMEEAYADLPASKKPGPVEFRSSPSGRPPRPGLLGRGISALNSAMNTAQEAVTGRPVVEPIDTSRWIGGKPPMPAPPAAAAAPKPAPSAAAPAPKPAAPEPNAPDLTPQAKPPAPKPAAKPPAAQPGPMKPPPAKAPIAQGPGGPTPMGGGARTPALAALPSSAAAGSPMPAPKPMFQEARNKLDAMRAQRAAHDASPIGQQYKAMTQKTGSALPPPGEITKLALLDLALGGLYGGYTSPEGYRIPGAVGGAMGGVVGAPLGTLAGGVGLAALPALAALLAHKAGAPGLQATLERSIGPAGIAGAILGGTGGFMRGAEFGRDVMVPRPQEKTSAEKSAFSLLEALTLLAAQAGIGAGAAGSGSRLSGALGGLTGGALGASAGNTVTQAMRGITNGNPYNLGHPFPTSLLGLAGGAYGAWRGGRAAGALKTSARAMLDTVDAVAKQAALATLKNIRKF